MIPCSAIVAYLEVLRRGACILGQRLTGLGGLEQSEDIFNLTASEVFALADVLIPPSTDPAWTPLFLKAGALVMETGGYLSHGAIVAREFGIPAVVNLPGILKST